MTFAPFLSLQLRGIAEAGSNPFVGEISSELAYAFGIPLQGCALRNDNY
jgi:hypothetical protein